MTEAVHLDLSRRQQYFSCLRIGAHNVPWGPGLCIGTPCVSADVSGVTSMLMGTNATRASVPSYAIYTEKDAALFACKKCTMR